MVHRRIKIQLLGLDHKWDRGNMAIIGDAPKGTPWGEVLSPIAQILQHKIEQHRQQQQQMQQGNIIDEIFSQLPQNADPMQQLRAFAQAQGRGVSPENINQYQQAFPKFQEQHRKQQEFAQQQNQVPSEGQDQVRDAFQRANEILESGYTGFSPTGLTPEGREQRSELDTLSEVFISHLIPLLNPKGTISKERFNYIKSLVPNSWDTDAKIKGKLKALRGIFKIDQQSQGGGQQAGHATSREMRDAQGNIYDIPEELYEQARSQGLQ